MISMMLRLVFPPRRGVTIIILYLSEFFTFNSWTDIQNLSKDFRIDNALLIGQKEFIRFSVFDLLNGVPELLHKYFRDIYRNSECLVARRVLDYINDDLKCLFLLMHSGFQSNRGSYIPWASCFRRYLNRKRETRKWLNKAIDEGPYEFKVFTPSETEAPRMQKEEDLRGDDLKHYEAEIEAMNLILISIPK
ncbi:hypothetical protein Tco_0645494 [Tanacetum coccineum]